MHVSLTSCSGKVFFCKSKEAAVVVELGAGTLLSFFLGGSGSPSLGEPILPCSVSEVTHLLSSDPVEGGDGAGTITSAEPLERFMGPR